MWNYSNTHPLRFAGGPTMHYMGFYKWVGYDTMTKWVNEFLSKVSGHY